MNIKFTYDSELPELIKLIGSDADLLKSFIEPFISELNDYSKAVPLNIKGGRVEDVSRAFHSLKVNAKLFGSQSLHELCKDLEALANTEGLKMVKQYEKDFVNQVCSLREQLQHKLKSL